MGIKEKILEIATEAVADREFTHGECVENNKNIADLWLCCYSWRDSLGRASG